jgi:hypothetical protein
MAERETQHLIFSVSIADVQEFSMRQIGRHLSEDELYTASKCIVSGLDFGLDIVLRTAVNEAIGK